MRIIITIFFALLISNVVSGQQIEGNVSSTNTGLGLENIRIKATSLNDTTKQKETTTDFSGNYVLKDVITGYYDLFGFGDEKMIITYNGSQMEINITSNKDITNGKLYTVDGKTISATHFEKVGFNEFKAVMNMPGIADQMLLFSDGIHPAQKIIPKMLPAYGTQKIDFSENKNNLKSISTEENQIKFELDDDASIDNYQPLEVIKTVDLENTNYFDFEMEKWPEFFANMYFNLQDKFGNKQNNTNIGVKGIDNQYSFDITTDSNGDAQITNISIPNIKDNKLIPDSLDFAVEVKENNYLLKFRSSKKC